jgi:hypothetical protein
MTWVKVDDTLHGHPKARRAGLEAMGLWVVAASWSAAYKQDGYVSADFVATWPKGKKLAASLVAVGLWTLDPNGHGWWFHDWLDYQPSAAEIEAERLAARERQRRHRARRRAAQEADDHA